jgi:hypothetical protein
MKLRKLADRRQRRQGLGAEHMIAYAGDINDEPTRAEAVTALSFPIMIPRVRFLSPRHAAFH